MNWIATEKYKNLSKNILQEGITSILLPISQIWINHSFLMHALVTFLLLIALVAQHTHTHRRILSTLYATMPTHTTHLWLLPHAKTITHLSIQTTFIISLCVFLSKKKLAPFSFLHGFHYKVREKKSVAHTFHNQDILSFLSHFVWLKLWFFDLL